LTSVVQNRHTFVAMDALRGVAAICVIMQHFGIFFGATPPRGFLAVDFFFMLSGFVLTFAYQERLDSHWPTFTFFKVRLIRLYPLYIVGLVLGTIFAFLEQRYGSGLHMPHTDILPLFVLALFFLPAVGSYPAGDATPFPLNVPSWSLFDELLANLFHAFFLRRRSLRFLAAVVAISGLVLGAAALHAKTAGFGPNRVDAPLAVVRVIFGYTFGSVIFRLWKADRFPAVKAAPIVLTIFLVLSFLVPVRWGNPGLVEFLIISLFYPVLLLASARAIPSKRTMRFAALLGSASYGMYVLHAPCAFFFEQLWRHLLHRSMESCAPWGGICFLIVLIGIVLALDVFYDAPAREMLRRRFIKKTA
jgi:peptidoglycan/LPS O-acetylase OafA/YrhL